MITLAQAQASLLASVSDSELPSEVVGLSDALGRVASKDVFSDIMIPPSDNSAMDGFAVNSQDLAGESQTMDVSQRVPAGIQPDPLLAGTAARIFTGGVMPDGADAVVIQENCTFDSSAVTIHKSVSTGANVRPAGQDISSGAKVISQGQRLTAIDLSLLASIGQTKVSAYCPLKVAIFSTGDELIEPGQALRPGQIYNSNRTLLMALCRQLGFAAIDCGIVEDTLLATKDALADAAARADVILSSGGVSVGEEDHVKPAVEALGSLDMWKVQMKPGKPVAYGRIADKPFLGLPGNPVSSFVVFQLLAVPLLRALQRQNVELPVAYKVESGFAKDSSSREEYIRVRLECNDSGVLVAKSFANLSSGVMSSLSWADGLIRHQIGSAIEVGDAVEFLPLNEGML